MDKANFVTSDDKGGDVNTKHNKNGQWSIFRSIWNNSWNVFTKRHWNKGDDITANDETYRLHKACSNGDKETVELLLKNNAQINEMDERGDTPLFHAVKYGWKDIINILLEEGADVNCAELGNTPLHVAAYNGYAELVKILIDRGANVNSRDLYGITPLHWAVKRPNEIITPKKTENKKHLCYNAVTPDNVEIVEILLNNGADTNITSNKGGIPLFFAYKYQKIEIIDILLNEGDYTTESYLISECNDYYPTFTAFPGTYSKIITIHKILEEYIIKRAVLGLSVTEKDFLGYPFDRYKFQSKCKQEVESMKYAIINSRISIYEIVTLCIDQLETFLRNELTVQSFIWSDYETKFPIYGRMLKGRFRRGLEKKELLKNGEIFLRSVFHGLPHTCCSGILSYLNVQDLKTLANLVIKDKLY